MKKINLLFVILFLTTALQAQDPVYKVFLMGGQSNMVGNCDDNSIGDLSNENPDILIKVFGTANYGWGPLKGGLGSISTVHGPEVSFGYTMDKALAENNKVLLIKGAWSGTDLNVRWRPPSSGGTTGDLYNEFINGVNDALGELGHDFEISGMCWLQGESDAFSLDYANAYQTNLVNLIADLRQEFSAPDMPFVISKIIEYPDYTYNNIVRDAQQAVADNDPLVGIFDISGVDISDGHYVLGACNAVGNSFANEMSDLSGLSGNNILQTPYGGYPHPVPGIIEFEDYDEGGEGVAYHDSDPANNGGEYRPGEGVDIQVKTDESGGYNIGWLSSGEWLEYTINVENSGSYQFNIRTAGTANNVFHIEIDGVDISGPLSPDETGGLQEWASFYTTLNLPEGERVMRVVIDQAAGGLNLDKMIIESLDVVWEFNEDLESWTLMHNISGESLQGILYLEITGADPYMHSPEELNISTSNHLYIKIRMKNLSEDNQGRIYFVTGNSPNFSEDKSVSFELIPNDTDFTEYVVDMSQNSNWEGDVMQIRLDPLNTVSSGSIEIDYIIIEGYACTPQTISLEHTGVKYIDDLPFELNATASSGLPVSLSVISGPATIEGNIITLTGETGIIEILAEQPGNSMFCEADKVKKNIFVKDPNATTETEQLKAYADQWTATDGVDRVLPGYEDCGDYRPDKYVGVFYWLWHPYIRLKSGPQTTVTELMLENPDSPAFECNDYYWGEPENGFYHPSDPWSTRRNLQMLANAGVDFIFFDFTNGDQGCNSLEDFMNVALEMYNQGIPVPRISFFMNANYDAAMSCVLNNFYNKPEYEPLFFLWQGKPLIMGDLNKCADQTAICEDEYIIEQFTWKKTWAFNPGQWNFLDEYPQDYYSEDGVAEQISVSKALGAPIGDGSGKGSSYHKNTTPEYDQYWETELSKYGYFFEEQWGRAHHIDPSIVCLTGWNEWTAAAWPTHGDKDALSFMGKSWGDPSWRCVNPETCLSRNPDGTHKFPHGWYFVDEFNKEFNRDIEPMKDGYTDNYYYQMIANIRKYKGMSPPQPLSDPKTIEIDGSFDEWQDVTPVFTDAPGDVMDRNYRNVNNSNTYTTSSARNDIVESRAIYDSENVYFYVRTKENLTSSTDPNWMLLFIDADRKKGTGWEGYDFVINHSITAGNETTIKRWNGRIWTDDKPGSFQVSGNEMEISIPREHLRMSETDPQFYYHWADNPKHLKDITAFFTDCESAPDRRFNYVMGTTDVFTGTQSPYKKLEIPGEIQFEDFDKGGAGIAYSDADIGNTGNIYRTDESVDIAEINENEYAVSWINDKEWLKYTVNINAIGIFTTQIRYSSENENSRIVILVDGRRLADTITLPATTGAQNWETLEMDVQLTAGRKILEILIAEASIDMMLDKIIFIEKDVVYPGEGEGLIKTLWTAQAGGRGWFLEPVCSETDTLVYMDIEDVSPGCGLDKDFWNARWEGKLEPLYSEEYTFYLTANDIARLWVNDQLIIDSWLSSNSGKTRSGKISLEANEKVNIQLDYGELTGKASVKLEWESLSNSKEVIPKSQLFPVKITSTPSFSFKGDAIKIYPNPVTENLIIDAGEMEITAIQIYDISGRNVYNDNTAFTGAKSFQTTDIKDGIYFIRLISDDEYLLQKVIIHK